MTMTTRAACAGALLFVFAASVDLGPEAAPGLSGEWNFSELLILGPEAECLGGGNVVFSLSDTVVSGTATR